MNTRHFLILCCAMATLLGCQPNTDNNKTLDFETLQVNFSAAIKGQAWAEGDQMSVLATCTRNDQTDFSLSENPVATYKLATAGTQSLLVPSSESDKAVALSSDHNFQFYGVFPRLSGAVSLTSIPTEVPAVQEYSEGLMSYLTFFGSAKVISILPTINFNMKTIFSVIEFYVPNDLRDGFESTIRTMEITPANPESFTGYLAPSGVYDAKEGKFTLNESKSTNKITVDFGTKGLPLMETYTKIDVAIAPMKIPEGGLSVKFIDIDGSETVVSAIASEKEVGTDINAGDIYPCYVSGISDGIIPVKFPVVFPLGYPDGDNTKTGYCNIAQTYMTDWTNSEACASSTKTSQLWTGQYGTIHCAAQDQATVTWNWSSEIVETGIKHFIETANTSKYHISTFGVKGVWTNDFFEFTIPVRKFAAGSKVTLTMPIYTRSGPTFWEVLYKDGEEWETTAKENLPAFEGSEVTRKATWAVPFGGAAATASIDTDQTVTMTFTNEIKSGLLMIRVKCVDGTIVSSADNTVTTVEKPTNSSGTGSAPFYFWNPDPEKRLAQAITIEVK